MTNISITTTKLVDSWLTWLKSIGGRSEKTIISYRNDLQKFLNFMSNHFQDNMSPEKLKNIELIDSSLHTIKSCIIDVSVCELVLLG